MFDIDKKLPSELKQFKLPKYRKEFITKLITLRVENLLNIKTEQ